MSLLSYYKEGKIEAGCDEAGRGCLAGPVFGAAVILPSYYSNSLITDSKQLSEKNRYFLREEIINISIDYSIGIVDHALIDKINIFKASMLAIHRALDKLDIKPEHLIIDGNKFIQYKNIPFSCIVKGDSKYLSIAAASILAKTFRDDYMNKIHLEHNTYGWNKNKGYPTKEHKMAIEKYGLTPYHRRSFKLINNQMKFEFK